VYTAKGAALEVLREHFEEPESEPPVWGKGDPAQVRRPVVALRVMAPNAWCPIEDRIPSIYPGVRLSYGQVQSRAVEAEVQAGAFTAKADLSGVRAGALEEIFSQGQPVLGGVDLGHGYLLGLGLRERRGGEDWAEVLKQGQEQGLNRAVVVKDAAKGIESGVREVFPQAEQRAECFPAR
jgi:Transposase, Mutator family